MINHDDLRQGRREVRSPVDLRAGAGRCSRRDSPFTTLLEGSGGARKRTRGDSSLGTLQPTIVADVGQVSFWCGMLAPEPTQIAACHARLGKSLPSQVFPVRFESDVDLVGGLVAGELPGFLVLEDFKTMRPRTVI